MGRALKIQKNNVGSGSTVTGTPPVTTYNQTILTDAGFPNFGSLTSPATPYIRPTHSIQISLWAWLAVHLLLVLLVLHFQKCWQQLTSCWQTVQTQQQVLVD